MNPRQRRGVVLIGLGVVGAVAVLVVVFRFVADVRSQLGPTVEVLQLREDVPAFTSLGPDQVGTMEVPRRWAAPNSLRDVSQLAGFVAATDLPAGSVLSTGMLVEDPAIEEGQREIAILVSAGTAVAGKIKPGDLVDVYATFPGTQDVAPSARILLQRVRIVEVGNPVTTRDPGGAFAEQQQAVPITFALSVEESRELTFAEAFASSVRLGLRSPTDDEILPDSETVYQPTFGSAGGPGGRLPSDVGVPEGGGR